MLGALGRRRFSTTSRDIAGNFHNSIQGYLLPMISDGKISRQSACRFS